MDRQVDLCEQYVADRGWRVGARYIDNDVSATTGVVRPAFERMLVDRPARIIVWHTDRLARTTKDLERVIDLGADVYAVKAGHLDLSNPAGRAVARTVTAWATYEGEQRTERQRASNHARALRGEPHKGSQAYGYSQDGWEVVEAEAAVIRQCADDVLSGRSLAGLARELNDRCVPTPRAGRGTQERWRPVDLRRMLTNPTYAALAVHRGEVVGKGQWPPIIEEADHHALVALLTDPSRRVAPVSVLGRGGPRYLMSGITFCARCGGPMRAKPQRRGYHQLVCSTRPGPHLAVKMQPVEDHVVTAVLHVLTVRAEHPWLFEPRDSSRDDSSPSPADLDAEAERLRDRLSSLAEAFAADTITLDQLSSASRTLKERLAEVEMQRVRAAHDASSSSPVLPALLTGASLTSVWGSLPFDRKREVIADLARITVASAGRGTRTYRPETVTFEWKVPVPVKVLCSHTADGDEGTLWVEEVNDDGASRGWAPLLMRVDRQHGAVHMLPDRPCSCAPDPDRLTWAREHGVLVIDAASGS